MEEKNRKFRNACTCGNTEAKHSEDKYKTIFCKNCLEVISYIPVEKKKKKKQLTIDL